MTLSSRLIDMAVALLLLIIPVVLLLVIYPQQVPKSPFDDIDARLYPNTIALVWALIAAFHLWQATRRPNRLLEIAPAKLGRITAILSIVLAGYFILVGVGFVIGAFFYILGFSWMLGERRIAAWVVAIGMPPLLYLIMLYGFELRLPSVLNRF